MTEKRMICLSCPMGCDLTAHIEDGHVMRIEGSRCPRGDVYGRQEATHPMRILPSSVRVLGGNRALVSVKTDRPIPLELIRDAMDVIRKASVEAPIRIGDTIITNLAGTGANLVATREINRNSGLTSGSTSGSGLTS